MTQLLLLLFTATAALAVTTVDVGANAVNGVWRPGSCAGVKDGVVLSNIAVGVRAIIEGCTIAYTGNDVSKAAVSIPSIASGASVELRNCNISSVFHTTTSNPFEVPSVVRIETNAPIGNNSRLIIDGTTVSIVDTGTENYVTGILFHNGATAGDAFQFSVANSSTVSVSCSRECIGIFQLGLRSVGHSALFAVDSSTVAATARVGRASAFRVRGTLTAMPGSAYKVTRSTLSATALDTALGWEFLSYIGFHPRATIATIDSTISVRSSKGSAYGIRFGNLVFLSSDSAVSVTGSNISAATDAAGQRCIAVDLTSLELRANSIVAFSKSLITATAPQNSVTIGVRFGTFTIVQSTVSVGDCTIVASTSMGCCASGLSVADSSFKENTAFSIDGTNISITAATNAVGLFLDSSASFGANARFSIHESTVTTAADAQAFPVRTSAPFAANATISISGSELYSSASADSSAFLLEGLLRSASIAISSSKLSFNGSAVPRSSPTAALACSNTTTWDAVSLAVTATTIRSEGELSASSPSAAFVLWPKQIVGVSPQSFDGVTFAAATGTKIPPFAFNEGPGPGGNTTLCLRQVRWYGARVISGPAAFTVPAGLGCSVPSSSVTLSGSLSRLPSRSASRALTQTQSASSTLIPAPSESHGVSSSTSASHSETHHLSSSLSVRTGTTQRSGTVTTGSSSPTLSVTLSMAQPNPDPQAAGNTPTRTASSSIDSATRTAAAPFTITPTAGTMPRTLSPPSSRTVSVGQSQTQQSRTVDLAPSVRPSALAAAPVPIPPAVEAVATTTATAGGVAAAFVGAGMAGATQAGRTLAILQLITCSGDKDEGLDDGAVLTAAKVRPSTNTNQTSGGGGHEDEDDIRAAPFPQALMPWVRLGAGQAGWDRGVVIGNAAAVCLVVLLGFGVWAAAARLVSSIADGRPLSWAAKLGADNEAPEAANTAAVRVSRLLRLPGIAVVVPVGFAIDGFVGEAVALIRHGAEGRFGAVPADVAFGSIALIAASTLWAALLYVGLVVVPRSATYVPNPTANDADETPSGRSPGPPTKANGRTVFTSLYRRIRAWRDGNFLWTVTRPPPDCDVSGQTTDTQSADIFSNNSSSATIPQPTVPLCCCPPQGNASATDCYIGRCRFAARWSVLFAPLRHGGLFFPAVDAAASVAVAIARGLRPRTPDGCQRALFAVAAAQISLLAIVLILRPFAAPLKTAVVAAASALLALSAVVGAAAGGISDPGTRAQHGAAAAYLAMWASIVLLLNPAMALWRVLEARVAARATNHSSSRLHAASSPLLDDGEGRPTMTAVDSSFSFEMDFFGRDPGPANAPGWVWGGNHGEVCDAMADLVGAEAEAPVDIFPDPFEDIGPAMTPPPQVHAHDHLHEAPAVVVEERGEQEAISAPIIDDDFDFDIVPAKDGIDEEPGALEDGDVHRRVFREGEVVVAKSGHGAVIAAELEAMFSGFVA